MDQTLTSFLKINRTIEFQLKSNIMEQKNYQLSFESKNQTCIKLAIINQFANEPSNYQLKTINH